MFDFGHQINKKLIMTFSTINFILVSVLLIIILPRVIGRFLPVCLFVIHQIVLGTNGALVSVLRALVPSTILGSHYVCRWQFFFRRPLFGCNSFRLNLVLSILVVFFWYNLRNGMLDLTLLENSPVLLLTRTKTSVILQQNVNVTTFQRTMKRLAKLSLENKKEISTYTKLCIETLFVTPTKNKQQYLEKVIAFSQNNSCSELIAKQTILKGCTPRMTWLKKDMLDTAGVSPKISVAYPKEVSDVRFITELTIADNFAQSSSLVQTIIFNTENPRIAIASTTGGNKYNDITINFKVEEQTLSLESDIKSGNNAYKAFDGILGTLPVTENYQPYTMMNENVKFTLKELQTERVFFLERAPNEFQKHTANIKDLVIAYPHDQILMNTLIQDELLKCIALHGLTRKPSFFTAHKISESVFNEKYFKLLEPHINENIFDNKVNFNRFMTKALRIYNDHFMDISGNITNNFWRGTGFEEIADDVFK